MQNKDKGDGIEDSPLYMLLVILLEKSRWSRDGSQGQREEAAAWEKRGSLGLMREP